MEEGKVLDFENLVFLFLILFGGGAISIGVIVAERISSLFCYRRENSTRRLDKGTTKGGFV